VLGFASRNSGLDRRSLVSQDYCQLDADNPVSRSQAESTVVGIAVLEDQLSSSLVCQLGIGLVLTLTWLILASPTALADHDVPYLRLHGARKPKGRLSPSDDPEYSPTDNLRRRDACNFWFTIWIKSKI